MVARIVNQTLQNLSVGGIEGLFPETSHLKICLQYMYLFKLVREACRNEFAYFFVTEGVDFYGGDHAIT